MAGIVNNNKIFNKIWNVTVKYGLSFISSNGGTGKTTYFKFRLLRDALNRNIPFHIFCRFGNQMEILASSFLEIKESYSKRQRALIERCSVYKENEKFVFIVETATGRKLCQILNIHGQSYYKPFGNIIAAKRALFDEVLAEDGMYCPDELNKFNRLIFTMARADKYTVFCLYNNSSPNFEYFSYYGGKSYNTHIAKSGALFIYFTAKQFSHTDRITDDKSIQHIIQNTAYSSVYNHNSFVQFEAYYKKQNLCGAETYFKIEIENRIFKIRAKDGYLYLDDYNAHKRSKKPLFSVNDTSRTKIKQLPDEARYSLQLFKENARLKTNNINNTIFVKILCERV